MIRPALLIVLAGLLISGCSIKKMATKSMADALTGGQDVFGTDNDPELVRDALPFGLKTLESLLSELPEHRGLLLSACKGFTQYGFAFVQGEAAYVEARDYHRAQEMRERALQLYLRARGYGLRGLELSNRGIGAALPVNPDSAAGEIEKQDQDLLYWTAASWGAAISVGMDHPELLADVSVVRAMMERGLELDETYDGGAFHEAMMILESAPAVMGGSPERARQHFNRAIEISGGRKASTYVTLAEAISVPAQNRAEFTAMLEKALAVDPEADLPNRLANLVIQKKARWMLSRADELFLDSPMDAPTEEGSKR
jgi:predicted anti-sigma-YlaC factor YlaD